MEDIYKAPESDLVNENAVKEFEYGGFWIRALASLIDSIWVIVLTFSLGWIIYGAIYFKSTEFVQGYADIFISYVLPFVITMAFWFYKSATPGKMALGLKIVDAKTLNKASTRKLVVRYLGYYVSLLAIGLGYFWVGWDKKKQAWHDKMAGTLVVKID